MFRSLSFFGCTLRRNHFTELLRIHLAVAQRLVRDLNRGLE